MPGQHFQSPQQPISASRSCTLPACAEGWLWAPWEQNGRFWQWGNIVSPPKHLFPSKLPPVEPQIPTSTRQVCSPEHWVWVLFFLSWSHQHLELYYFMAAAVKSTHITPPSVLLLLGNSRFSCASPLAGPSVLILRSCSSYPPEIWFACVLLCWTQQGWGCLLKFPMGTTDCNQEISLSRRLCSHPHPEEDRL